MFDQFGGTDIGDYDRCVERRINFLHGAYGAIRTNSDYDAIGPHQVFDGRAFPEEFRIAYHIEIDTRFTITLDGVSNLGTGFHRNGTLVDDDLIASHGCGNFAGNLLDEA